MWICERCVKCTGCMPQLINPFNYPGEPNILATYYKILLFFYQHKLQMAIHLHIYPKNDVSKYKRLMRSGMDYTLARSDFHSSSMRARSSGSTGSEIWLTAFSYSGVCASVSYSSVGQTERV